MHRATNSVKCTFPSGIPQRDVVCVCGSCGSKRDIRQWVPLEVQAVHSRPTMGLKNRSKFESCAAQHKDFKGKGKGKGKSDVGPIHRPAYSNPGPVPVVPTSEAEHSAASFQGPSDVRDHQRIQPMRQAPLLRITIVDSDIAQQPVFPKGSGIGSSSSRNSTCSSSSSCSISDGGSSSIRENDDSEDDDVYMSGYSIVCAAG